MPPIGTLEHILRGVNRPSSRTPGRSLTGRTLNGPAVVAGEGRGAGSIPAVRTMLRSVMAARLTLAQLALVRPQAEQQLITRKARRDDD